MPLMHELFRHFNIDTENMHETFKKNKILNNVIFISNSQIPLVFGTCIRTISVYMSYLVASISTLVLWEPIDTTKQYTPSPLPSLPISLQTTSHLCMLAQMRTIGSTIYSPLGSSLAQVASLVANVSLDSACIFFALHAFHQHHHLHPPPLEPESTIHRIYLMQWLLLHLGLLVCEHASVSLQFFPGYGL